MIFTLREIERNTYKDMPENDKELSFIEKIQQSYHEEPKEDFIAPIKKLKLRAMPNVVSSNVKASKNWKPTFHLGDISQLEVARKHFTIYVGFVGSVSNRGVITLNSRGKIHKGKAFPKPINKKGTFCGILQYEIDTFDLLFIHKEVMLKWAREHGKTYMATWFIEWSMLFCGKIGRDEDGNPQIDEDGKEIVVPESWIYFSVTKVKAKVGFWVWRWAKRNKLILNASKGDKQQTYTSFEISNGAQMKIFDYMDEAMVGEHNWNFALDDVVKKRWENRPTDIQRAKDQWDFSINYIGHDRVFVFGTRKFLGDPLEHLEEVLEDIVIDIRTPFVMEGDFPKWHPKMGADGREILIAPEIHDWVELDKKRRASKRAWMAEEMQDPQALGSKVWSKVNYIPMLEDPYVNHYETLFIYLDRATTTGRKSDFTGCVIGVREITTGRRVVIDDWTQKIPMEHLLYDLCVYVIEFAKKYPHMRIILVIEQQGGGDDFLSAIELRSKFEKIILDEDGRPVKDAKGKIIVKKVENVLRNYKRIPIHNTGDKELRIIDRLENPLKDVETGIMFLSALRGSEVVQEILDFPNNRKIDGLDALATGDWELQLQFPLEQGEGGYKGVAQAFDDYTKKVDKSSKENAIFEQPKNKELDVIKQKIQRSRKGIFDS